MTIARVNAVGWAAFEKLTSTQANGLDINTTYALDKRTGQTDTLESVVTTSGAGRVIPTHAAGANANTNYTAAGGNTVLRIPSTISADRTYTFQNTNASAGDAIHIYSDDGLTRTITIADHSGDVICRLGSSPYLDDDFDARGCVLRHNGTDWFLESLSYGRTEVQVRMAQLGVAMFRLADNGTIADYGGVCFDVKNGRYYFGGGTDVIGYSNRAGYTIQDDVIPAPNKATLRILDIAASESGVVVATTNNTSCYTQPDGGSFARYAPFAAGTLKAAVTFDPVTSRFVVAAATISVAQLIWSVDGVVWNNYGAPPTVPTNPTSLAIGTNKLGRTVAAVFDTNGEVRFNYSDDGGTSWSAGSTVALTATGFGSQDITHSVIYNDVRNEWAVCVGFTNTTEVLTSADGATWAVAFSSGSASDPEVYALEAVNGLWVGVGRVAYDVLISRDGFTSMQFVGMRLDATSTGDVPSLCVGGSQLMAFAEGSLFHAPTFGRGLRNLT